MGAKIRPTTAPVMREPNDLVVVSEKESLDIGRLRKAKNYDRKKMNVTTMKIGIKMLQL